MLLPVLTCASVQGGGIHGGGFQAALRGPFFEVLSKHFCCAQECFASPLNCRWRSYCSAFADVDAPFGGRRSFFDFEPKLGCFEANPPFTSGVMLRMVAHMSTLLSRAHEAGLPLCFVVVIPAGGKQVEEQAHEALKAHEHLTHHELLASREHGYTEGLQHTRRRRHRISTCDSSVFFLQTAAAAARWPVQEEQMVELREAAKHVEKKGELCLLFQKGKCTRGDK